MKKFALLLSALLVAGAATAATQATNANKAKSQAPTSAKSSSSQAASAMKTHTIEAEVVSADATAKTLTVKVEGADKTLPVEGAAVSELKSVKAGEKVKLTCRDNAQGEHQAITKIHAEKSSSTAKTPKK